MALPCPETAAHHGNEVTGLDRVIDAQPMMEVRIVSSPQVVLVATVVGFFINHETATLHPDGVALVQEAHQVRTVTAALKMAPREVLALIEDDLDMGMVIVSNFILIDPLQHLFIIYSVGSLLIEYIYQYLSILFEIIKKKKLKACPNLLSDKSIFSHQVAS